VIPICDISSIKTNSFKSTPSSDDSYNKNTVESSSNHQMQKNVLHSTYAEAIESECLEHYEINLERYKGVVLDFLGIFPPRSKRS